MKRIFAIVLILLLLIGCGSAKKTEPKGTYLCDGLGKEIHLEISGDGKGRMYDDSASYNLRLESLADNFYLIHVEDEAESTRIKYIDSNDTIEAYGADGNPSGAICKFKK